MITILLLGGLLCGLGVAIAKWASRGADATRVARLNGLAIAIGGGLAAGLGPLLESSRVGQEVEIALGLKYRSQIVVGRSFEHLLEHPVVGKALRGKSTGQAQAYTAACTQKGLALLDNGSLERWMGLRSRLANASPQLCTAMWKGGATPALVFRGLDQLSIGEQQQWGDLCVRACILSATTPIETPSSQLTVAEAIAQISATMPEGERATFLADSANPALPPPRACELTKTLFSGARSLPSERRVPVYRALAAGG